MFRVSSVELIAQERVKNVPPQLFDGLGYLFRKLVAVFPHLLTFPDHSLTVRQLVELVFQGKGRGVVAQHTL